MEGCVQINEFPDDILLEIFSKLSFVDQIKCSGVCCRWYSLIRSIHHKKIVIHRNLNGHLLHHIIQNQFSKQLEVLELWNIERCFVLQVKLLGISTLTAKCPKLKKLVLSECYVEHTVTLFDMPETLEHLTLRNSRVDPDMFFNEPVCLPNVSDLIYVNSMGVVQHLRNYSGSESNSGNISKEPKVGFHVSNLTCLVMCKIPLLRNENVHVLLRLKNLRYLYLQQCYSVSNAGIKSIISMLPQLRVFDVEATGISNEGVQIILTHGANLKELYIGYNRITDDALINVPTSELSTLCLKCTQMTPDSIEQFYRNVGNQLKILRCDVSFDYASENSLIITGCNHHVSHICC